MGNRNEADHYTSKILRIGKLDAARRQADAAVKLYFEGQDTVSVHTLAAAANGVLEDIYSRNESEIVRKQLEKVDPKETRFSIRTELKIAIKDEYHQDFFRKLNAPANFFKHADKDPDGNIEFNEFQTEYMILSCCQNYKLITDDLSIAMTCFSYFMMIKHPRLIKEEYKNDKEMREIKSAIKDSTNHYGLLEFFCLMLFKRDPNLFGPVIRDMVNHAIRNG